MNRHDIRMYFHIYFIVFIQSLLSLFSITLILLYTHHSFNKQYQSYQIFIKTLNNHLIKHSFNSILHYTLLLSPLSIQIINPSFIHLLIYSTIHSLSFHIILSLLPFLYQSHHLHHIYSYLLYHLIIISILHFTYNFISLYTTSPFSQIYYLSTIHSSITLIHINYSN